jgi:hypothetical protein
MQSNSQGRNWLSNKNLSIAIVLLCFISMAVLFSTPSVNLVLVVLGLSLVIGAFCYIRIVRNTVAEWTTYKQEQKTMGIIVLVLLLPMLAIIAYLIVPVLSLHFKG